MRRILLPVVLSASLAACATMDQNRAACAALLGRTPAPVTDDKPVEGGPVTVAEGVKPAPIDPAVEACAVRRAEAQRQETTLITAAILLGAAAGATRSTYRPSYYHSSYRSPARRR